MPKNCLAKYPHVISSFIHSFSPTFKFLSIPHHFMGHKWILPKMLVIQLSKAKAQTMMER
jgi:hypothetical protein